MVRLLGQVEDLFTRVRGRNCILPLSGFDRIVLLPIIVSIVEFLKPLNKIQVVLETPLHQLLHWDYLINVHPFKGRLEKFKVVNILMLQLCLEFYFLQTNTAREEHVHELAIGRS